RRIESLAVVLGETLAPDQRLGLEYFVEFEGKVAWTKQRFGHGRPPVSAASLGSAIYPCLALSMVMMKDQHAAHRRIIPAGAVPVRPARPGPDRWRRGGPGRRCGGRPAAAGQPATPAARRRWPWRGPDD